MSALTKWLERLGRLRNEVGQTRLVKLTAQANDLCNALHEVYADESGIALDLAEEAGRLQALAEEARDRAFEAATTRNAIRQALHEAAETAAKAVDYRKSGEEEWQD